jgi:hypothetical protein
MFRFYNLIRNKNNKELCFREQNLVYFIHNCITIIHNCKMEYFGFGRNPHVVHWQDDNFGFKMLQIERLKTIIQSTFIKQKYFFLH